MGWCYPPYKIITICFPNYIDTFRPHTQTGLDQIPYRNLFCAVHVGIPRLEPHQIRNVL